MRRRHLVVAVALGLAGCLQPVDVSRNGEDASSGDGSQSGLDAQRGQDAQAEADASGGRDAQPALDAALPQDAAGHSDGGPHPDGGSGACKSDLECPDPVQTDPVCNPLKATCDHATGTCGSVRTPRRWDTDPGACNFAAECDCQGLAHEKCTGSFLCALNRCAWKCGGCTTDLECNTGQICQEVSCGKPKQCVDGCHDTGDCDGGKICGNFVLPFCGDAFGSCIEGNACQSEKECPIGTACDYVKGSPGEKACIPGCHEDQSCPIGQVCIMGPCPLCASCPCVGTCETKTQCKADTDCPPNLVCGTDSNNCNPHCRPGCHNDRQCNADEQCAPLPACMGCGCDTSTCMPRPETCKANTDCPTGEVCAFDNTSSCSGAKDCKPGCFEKTDCAAGYECMGTSGCTPGRCTEIVSTCSSDQECEVDAICTYDDFLACTGKKSCHKGCRSSTTHQGTCQPGEVCSPTYCGPCCPGTCAPAPGCLSDLECGAGKVCEQCKGAGVCVAGCHNATQCAANEVCNPRFCTTCPCPGACEAKSCVADKECPAGTTCDFPETGATGKVCVPGCHTPDNCPGGAACRMPICPKCTSCPCVGTCDTSCPNEEKECKNTVDCGAWGTAFCSMSATTGCCTYCPVYDLPPCNPGECSYGNGVDRTGCSLGASCRPCVVCLGTDLPVCGVNYQTYACAAEAVSAKVEVLHAGGCLQWEGVSCTFRGFTCPTGQYCRDECPMCDALRMRCTESSSCVNDWDCQTIGHAPCVGAKWACKQHTCVASCP